MTLLSCVPDKCVTELYSFGIEKMETMLLVACGCH